MITWLRCSTVSLSLIARPYLAAVVLVTVCILLTLAWIYGVPWAHAEYLKLREAVHF